MSGNISEGKLITIDTKDFLRGINLVALAIDRKNTIPVLACMRAQSAADGGLRLSGTNLDLQVDVSMPADLNGSGEFAMALTAPKMLGAAAKKADGAMISVGMEGKNGGAVVNCGRLDCTWSTMPVADWPDMDVPRCVIFSTTLGADFIDALRRVRHCVSEEETRYYLNGVYVHADEKSKGCVLVATDGHRLSRISAAMPTGKGKLPGVIIPRQTVGAILTAAKTRSAEPVHFTVSSKGDKPGDPHLCEFRIGNVRIISKLIDGSFPAYQRVIPAKTPIKATFARADLLQAAHAVSIGQNPIRFDLSAGNASLSSVSAIEGATGKTSVAYNGKADGCVFGINARYFAELLTAFAPHEQVTLAFSSVKDAPSAPITVTSPEDGAALSVIMPMRV